LPCNGTRSSLEATSWRCGVGLVTNDSQRTHTMAWTTPTLVEICVGLEINGYLPAEF
jgi:coenzyme PQQ precursor peptide PqqA